MKKKIFSFVWLVCTAISLFIALPMTVNAETEGIYEYTIENGEAIFTGFNESVSGNVVIPSILGNCPVTAIGENAFYSFECINITNITIPESVTDIKNTKFDMCRNLISINVKEGNPVYSSVDGVLFNKDKTTLIRYTPKKSGNSYIVPDGVTTIAGFAFSYCPNVTNITLPDGLISIGESAFEVCGNLSNITIPDSVTNIGNGAFKVCVDLTEINVSEANLNYCSIDGVLFDKNKTTLIQYPAAKYDAEYIIPESVTKIGDWALSYCQSSSITIPDSVTSIGDSSFRFCNNITDMVIPDSVISIADYAFYGCENLIDVTIPGSVTSIGKYSFYTCNSLIYVTIPDGVISLGWGSFGYCKNLKGISIPASVTGDVKAAIRDNEKLERIDVDVNNANYSSVDGVLFNKDKTTLIQYPIGKGDAVYYIPDGVISIEKNAFEWCSNVVSIAIPDGVTSIGAYAFGDCESLTNIRIPASVTTIEEDAFSGCESLGYVFYGGTVNDWKSIDIGGYNYALESADFYYECKHTLDYKLEYTIENDEAIITGCSRDICGGVIIPETIDGCPVTTIASGAFYNCYKLINIIIPDSVTSIRDRAFEYCGNMTNITIPAGVIGLGNEVFYGCSSLTDIDVDEENPSYCSIDGVLFNKDKTTLIQYPKGKSDETYSIPDGVTNIGNYAFWNCGKLTNVSIPDGVITIGRQAFFGCNKLTDIIIPESVTSVGVQAFSNCRGVTNITIPEGITSIENHAFSWCKNVTDITIPASVKSIGNSAFSNCRSLTNVTIPANVTIIGNSAFYSCENLTNVYYGGSKRDWNAISIGNSNTALTYANVTFVEPKTETTLSNDDKTFTISSTNMKLGKTVILALYNGEQFVEMQHAIYDGGEISFTTTAAYTNAKVIVWDDMTDLTPVCEAEIVR